GDTWLLRDLESEAKEVQRLFEVAAGLVEATPMPGCLTAARRQLPMLLTKLVAAGIMVLADGKPFVRSESVRVSVATGIDWFDVDGVLDFGGGATLPLAAALLAKKRGERFVQLGDGKTGLLPDE